MQQAIPYLMYYHTDDEIISLITAFENKTLPKSMWTHDAHLTAAIYYLRHHDYLEAHCIMKAKIITYNESVGGDNTHTSGYHETLTFFWIKVIHAYLTAHPHASLVESCNNFLSQNKASRDLPLQYYTRERLFSTLGRATWIEPDKKTISS